MRHLTLPARQKITFQALAGGALIALASAAVLTWLSKHEFVGFDSFWHVFVARQETWSAFWREILENTHPPFFHLLLKAAIGLFGTSVLVYRAVPIAGIGIATVFIALAVATATRNAPLAIVAAAAFGLSANAIEIGIEIRSYGIFLAAVAAATAVWLEWLGKMPRATSPGTRIVFAAASSFAVLSHYSGFFVLAAMLATPPVLYLSHRRWRIKLTRELSRHGAALAAMFGVPCLVAVSVYWVLVHRYHNGLAHVAGFMFEAGTESRWAFVLRNGRNLLQLFVPSFGMPAGLVLGIWSVIGLVIFGILLSGLRQGHLAAVPLVTLVLLLFANVVAGLAGRYPFGGNSRHELFLFPFAILVLFAGIDGARRMMPSVWSSNRLWTTASAAAVATTVWLTLSSIPLFAEQPAWRAQINRFRSDFAMPPAVLVDQFNLVMFFGHYHDWRWHLRWQDLHDPMCQVWEVSQGDQRFSVCRAQAWQLDFSQSTAYADLSECLDRSGSKSVAVFRTQADGLKPTWDLTATPALAHAYAPKAGLAVQTIDVDGNNVYALFQASAKRN
ncbi:MAG: hypothetical protein ACLQDQ_16870 [Myxococcaceae bacterium]